MKCIASKGQADIFKPVIHEVFGEHLATPLLELLGNNSDSNKSQKRRLETESREGTTKKRQIREC